MKYPRLPHDLKQHIKLTVRDIELVRWLYHSGKIKSIARLASCFNTTPHTIQYWIDPVFRAEKIERRIKDLEIQVQSDPTYKGKQRGWKKNQYEYHIKTDPKFKEYCDHLNHKKAEVLSVKRKSIRSFKNFMEMIECHT